ncbi:MAG: hypothetical protein J1E06_07235 [Acutalibacter sp.]|nr:hypothetical protein [Acutalibacter sp.]
MKRLLALLTCLLLLLPLAGCSSRADMEFTAVLPSNVISLDPQTAASEASDIVIGSIFEGLCRITEDNEVHPGVAKSWDHNKDYTEFTFHLRSAKWSDGTAVTAEDFLFGILRALDPETGAADPDDLFLIRNARAIHNGEAGESALGVTVESDRKLVFHLESGYPDFPALTSGNHYLPCKQEFFEESAGRYGLSPEFILTNGPFTFPHIYAWNTDYNEKQIRLARSDTYRGEHRVLPSTLTYLIDYDVEIDSDPVAALMAEKADILQLTESSAKEAEEKGLQVLSLNDGTAGLLLNPQADDLTYVVTREIFMKTLDRESLLAPYADDPDAEAAGIMPDCVQWNGEPYYGENESCYVQQDDDAAQSVPSLLSLLKLSKMPSITVLCPDDEASIAMANGFLVSWNAKLGSAFNILPLPEDKLNRRVAWGDYDAALYTLRAGGVTPYNVLKAFDSNASPLLLEREEFDTALHSVSFGREAFRDMEIVLQEQQVFYPLLKKNTYYALSPKVENITVSADHGVHFISAKKRK